MKTLHKIGIVTLALSSLVISGCDMATTSGIAGGGAAAAIATFGNWGVRILWIYFIVELIKTIGSLSHPSGEGTVGSNILAGVGEKLLKRAKRATMTEVKAEKEGMKEWEFLRELERVVQGATAATDLDKIKKKLNRVEREESRMKRRVDRVVNTSKDFIAELEKNGDDDHATKVKEILKAVEHKTTEAESLSNILVLLMAKGGKFECCVEQKNFNKGSAPAPADHKDYRMAYGGTSGGPGHDWKKHKDGMVDLVREAMSVDASLVAKIKELVETSKKIRNS